MYIKSVLFLCLLIGGSQVGAYDDDVNEEHKLITVPIKETPEGDLFYVEVAVGQEEESRQSFNLLVSTIDFNTWLPSVEMSPTRGYKINGRPEMNKIGAGYGPYNYHDVLRDTWKIGQQVIERQQFALAYPREGSRYLDTQSKCLDGLLGLDPTKLAMNDPYYLFRNMYRSDLINHNMYSLYFNEIPADARDSNYERGALVFGGTDQRYFTGNFSYANMSKHFIEAPLEINRRSLNLTSVTLDWSWTNIETQKRPEINHLTWETNGRIKLDGSSGILKLDSTTKLFFGDTRILNKIHVDFIGATVVGSQARGRSGLYVFDDCSLDNKPAFVFTLDDQLELVVRPEDYVIEGQLDGRTVCFSAFMGKNTGFWAFGTRFLRKYYTLFDYENRRVGFATPK